MHRLCSHYYAYLAASIVERGAIPQMARGDEGHSPGLLQQAAVALETAGQRSLAVECIAAAAAGVAYHRGIWLAATRLYSDAGRHAEAGRFAGEVLRREPGNKAALHYRNRCMDGMTGEG